jgi:hypothetical protein
LNSANGGSGAFRWGIAHGNGVTADVIEVQRLGSAVTL